MDIKNQINLICHMHHVFDNNIDEVRETMPWVEEKTFEALRSVLPRKFFEKKLKGTIFYDPERMLTLQEQYVDRDGYIDSVLQQWNKDQRMGRSKYANQNTFE